MFYRFYILLVGFVIVSCDTDPEAESLKIEKWTLDSYEGNSFCTITFPSDSIQTNTILLDTFLGMNDEAFVKTEVNFKSNGQFVIFKNEETALLGTWAIKDQKYLQLRFGEDTWVLEIMSRNAGFLILKAKHAYPFLWDVRITLTN